VPGARVLLLLLALLASAGVVAVVLLPEGGSHGQPVAAATRPAAGEALLVPSERSLKADMIEALGYPPELVFFGGSRSMRYDPEHAQRLTGLRGFNLAMTNGKPEDAWAFANWLLERSPDTRLHWVWGIQVSTFYERPMDPGLLQDERLSRWFPPELLAAQSASLPTDAADVPADVRTNRRYRDDGLLLVNSYDKWVKRGRTLDQSLDRYIRQQVAKLQGLKAEGDDGEGEAAGAEGGGSRPFTYFERTLGLLNDHRVTPLIVSMPVHPRVLAELRRYDWQRNHDRFVERLEELQGRYDFAFLDLSEIDTFGGDPAEFYDGVHITRTNADRVIATMVREAPEAFE
jgi:hypothetical protein